MTHRVKTDIWQFQNALSARLLSWAGISLGAGTLLMALRNPVARGIAGQALAWGAIDGLIAWVGCRRSRDRSALTDAHLVETQAKERASLRRILWINTGLDLGYIAGGLALTMTRGQRSALARGTALGIALQGAFLFFFDLLNALALR